MEQSRLPEPVKQQAKQLEYATSDAAPFNAPPAATRRRDALIALLLAIAWGWASVMAGVGGDFGNVPLWRKLAILAGATVIVVMLVRSRNWGCLIAFGVIALWIIAVMLYWN